MIVIYHDGCYDGFTAAWVAKIARPDARLVPALYGKPIPEFELTSPNEEVYVIDISWPRQEVIALQDRCPNLRILDHHKTAQKELEGLPFATFDMTKSGAMLAWEFFFPLQQAPTLVEYVMDRDLWKFELPHSREVNTYIQMHARTLDVWDQLDIELEINLGEVIRNGMLLMQQSRQRVEEMCAQVQWGEVGGYRVPIVNASCLFSEVGNRLCELYPEASFAAYYFDRGDGWRQWGLRSRGDFDVSEIAKQYGGGGHKSASGFQMPSWRPLPSISLPEVA